MDSNKKKNSVRYKCQVRDINKKACLTRLQPDICFVTKVARGGRLIKNEHPCSFLMDEFSLRKLATVYTPDIRVRFHATFAPTLPRYTLRQRHKCRL